MTVKGRERILEVISVLWGRDYIRWTTVKTHKMVPLNVCILLFVNYTVS